ncbi:malate synthase [Stylonychia lemnae]|uniref:malate synthase n=1 Tax=Stylonychia lemnae TaxID=5949 RepID=A0A078AI20_STYLE|nr:malate synthase [Stylonychia lemnae]|eukprot:CDW81162.1 malate synthase [Stylonychia lemnae]
MEDKQIIKFTQKHFLLKNVLPMECLDLLLTMHNMFSVERNNILLQTQHSLSRFDTDGSLRQRLETHAIRKHRWVARSYPQNLQKRQVEITAPPNKKEVVNALNSGADVFMADFEDALSPTWPNILGGHYNMMKAIKRNLRFYEPSKSKEYQVLNINSQVMIRPRSLAKEEAHLLVDGTPISATIFDLTVYAYLNHQTLQDLGQSCYFYLPKINNMEEAIFWNQMLIYLEKQLLVPTNTFKVTVIVETVTAMLELEEIIFAFKHRIVGVNTGRWNYIFSIVKRFQHFQNSFIDSRHKISMEDKFMNNFNRYVVHIAHKRGIHVIGGASNYVPREHFPKATIQAKAQIVKEKREEANEGFDGSWVIHPVLVETAQKIFSMVVSNSPNQKQKFEEDEYRQTFDEIFAFVNSKCAEKYDLQVEKVDILKSIRVCIIYYFNWLKGIGAVAFENLMEDAATTEICRAQLWVWLHNRATITEKNKQLTPERLMKYIDKESSRIKTHDKLTHFQAKSLLKILLKQTTMIESFMEIAYPLLDKHQAKL